MTTATQTVPTTPLVRRPQLALAVIVTGYLMVALDTTVVTVALPELQGDLGFSATGLSWVQNGYMLAFGGLLLLGGRIGDLFGRRRTLVAGVGVFTIASLLGGVAMEPWQLVAARSAQGAGAALASPAMLALIVEIFQGPARVRALSMFSAVVGAGAAAGLLLGGFLTDAASWRWVMFINLPIGIVVLAAAPRTLPETPRREVRFDFAGAFLATGSALALVYGFITAADRGWPDAVTLVMFGLAAAGYTLFVLTQRSALQPVLPLRLLADRTRAFAYVNLLLVPSALFGMFFFTTQYLQQQLHYGPMRAGLAFLPLALAQFVFVRLAPRLLARFGARPIMILGSLLVFGALLWFSLIGEGDGYLEAVFGPLLLFGIGGAFSIMPLNNTVLLGVRPEEAGAASAISQSATWTGGALGSAVLLSVYSADHGMAAGLPEVFRVAAFAFALPAVLIAILLLRPREA
ncbi:MFS transporter [Actinocorallia longicatena]|uniref:MFS transporter n=1 Tax=Actinocorallia longicatena TaxID=111803 RepID=A0ABP6QKC1_9ACTN